MNINMQDWLSRFHDFVRGAWRKLPLETLAVATAALSAMKMVHQKAVWGALDLWALRLLLGSLLVAPLFFALTWLHERGVIHRRVRLGAGALVAAGVLVALTLALPDAEAPGEESFAWPYGLSLLGAMLVPFVAVAVRAGEDRLARFTVFLRRFFEQTTTWGLLWMGSMASLGVTFTALDELFDLDVDELGIDVALAVTGVLVLSYFSRLLATEERSARERMPELWRRLATTVGAPFVSVMLIILVIYEIVVLARGELPQNLLSPLIIGAGFVGFMCTLIIVSIQGEKVGSDTLAPADPHRWTRRASIRLARAFPPVLLALLPMAAWALSVRIEQHGLTPFRVARMMALLCLGTMSLLGTWRWLRGRMTLTWEVPLCVIAFAMATAFGPVSAVRLSLESQVRRLEQNLAASKLPRNVAEQSVPATHVIEWEPYRELRDGIQIVAELGGEPALRRVLTGAVAHCASRWNSDTCLERLGVVPSTYAHNTTWNTAQVQEPIANPGGDIEFVEVYPVAGHPAGLHLALAPQGVEVYDGERKLAEGSLADLLAAWKTSGVLPPRPIALVSPDDTSAGRLFGHLAVQRIELSRLGEDELQLVRLYGVWLRPPAASPPQQ